MHRIPALRKAEPSRYALDPFPAFGHGTTGDTALKILGQ
ncbi:hypothetical protein ABIB26_000244 [Arthrobacter sp. UYEF20]